MDLKKPIDQDEALRAGLRSFWGNGLASVSFEDIRAITGITGTGPIKEHDAETNRYLGLLAHHFERRGARTILSRTPLGFRNVRAFLKLGETSIRDQHGCSLIDSTPETHILLETNRDKIAGNISVLTDLLRQNIHAERPESDASMMADLTITFFSALCIERNRGSENDVTARRVRRFLRLLKTL
jgi:hypothetical protein